MAAYTLLDYVQTILSSLDSDEVNNYNDTVESVQVANIVKTVYNDIQARADLNEHYTLFELVASTTILKPTLMTRPSDVNAILWIEYDCIEPHLATDPVWRPIKFLPLDEFLRLTDSFNTDDENVSSFIHTIGTDTLTFKYQNDRAPTYYTTFNDSTVLFDAFNHMVDDTLQKTKTRCYGKKDQTFIMSDTFVPFFDRDMSTLLLNEAKILAFSELKQVGHDVAKQWANRGWTKVQKQKRGIDQDRSELDRAPNYGRMR